MIFKTSAGSSILGALLAVLDLLLAAAVVRLGWELGGLLFRKF